MSNNSLNMQKRAKKRIPGGTQLLSKRSEMFAPDQWPGYYSKAKGVETWDLDGKKYIDMSISGIGANVLGFADDDVDKAVCDVIRNANSCSLNSPKEVELADLMCQIHPWADMVRYTRSGGEAMSVAVRIARAHSCKDKVAFCGYHGWHDWYLAANLAEDTALDGHLLPGLEPRGVPRALAGTMIPFNYNKIEELESIIQEHGDDLGVIVMETIRNDEPKDGFLKKVRELADKHSLVLVFDEITAAFRMNSGGAHLLFDVNPDIAVFAKAISNGYPMGIILGNEKVMQSAQDTFISSTYWTEAIGPTAALATIKKHIEKNVGDHLQTIGKAVQDGWTKCAQDCGLDIHVGGIFPLSHFSFEGDSCKAMMTLFTQLMLERGFLASGRFYVMYAHKMEHVEAYLDAVAQVFKIISDAQKDNLIDDMLKGPKAHSGFRRLM